jgi:hypothetical protein
MAKQGCDRAQHGDETLTHSVALGDVFDEMLFGDLAGT